MPTTIDDRKEPMDDATVRRLVEELKAAMLAVNGDKEIKSLVIYADVTIDDHIGTAVVDMDICNCPVCLERAADALAMAFGKADAMRAEDVQNQAAKRRATHH